MENMIKNKMRKIQMELETPDSGATITDIIWEEGYLNGKLKAMEEILSVITIDK